MTENQPLTWSVYSTYVDRTYLGGVYGTMEVPVRVAPVRQYAPEQHVSTMLRDFVAMAPDGTLIGHYAKAKPGYESYIKKWGLAGTSTVLGEKKVIEERHRLDGTKYWASAESDDVGGVLTHARNLRLAINLLNSLQPGEREARRRLVEMIREQADDKETPFTVPTFNAFHGTIPVLPKLNGQSLTDAAWEIVAALLNPNLISPGRRIENRRSRPIFVAPIQLLYWYVSDELLGLALRSCKGCGELFVPKDVRQLFHNKRCGNRRRQQLLRAAW